MAYVPTIWVNNNTTPINANNLNKIEQGIKVIAENTDSTIARQTVVEAEFVALETNMNTLSTNMNTLETNLNSEEALRVIAEEARVTESNLHIDTIQADYNSYKNVMIAESNVAALQNQINVNASSLATSVQQILSKAEKTEVDAVDLRVDNLVIPLSVTNSNIEVTDSHNSIAKVKNFASLKDRLEESENESIINANLKLFNMIINSEFASTTGWTTSAVALTASPNLLRILTTATTGEHYTQQTLNGVKIIAGHKYYIKANISNIVNALARLSAFNRKADGAFETLSAGTLAIDGVLSLILTASSVYSTPTIYYRLALNNLAGAGSFLGTTEEASLSYPTIIDIDASFGQTNQPTKAELDLLVNILGEVNGELTTNQKAMANMYLTRIRTNESNILLQTNNLNTVRENLRPKAITVGGSDTALNFDFNAKQIVATNLRVVYGSKTTIFTKTLDIVSAYASASTQNRDYVLYYDTSTSTLKYLDTLGYATAVPSETAVIIAVFRPLTKLIWGCEFAYKINGITTPKYKYPLDTDLNKIFSKNATIPENTTIPNKTSAEIFVLYDGLVALYPTYITKTLLGNESSVSNLPLYRYDFNPVRPESNYSLNPPKVIITTGTHPEKTAAMTLYEVMKNICNNWANDETLEGLRHNIHFIVIPVASPWAFDNNSRVNSNGVDMARNYPSGWVQGTYIAPPNATSTYGGTAPLSEVEAQLTNQLILANLDALAVIDFHNFFNSTVEFLWAACGRNRTRDIVATWIQKMTRKWKKEYPTYTIGDFVGDVMGDYPGGSLGIYAEDLGIDAGMTVEIDQKFYAKADATANDSTTLTLAYEAIVNFLPKLIYEINQNR